MEKHFDVLIIGGGAVGCAVARELSRYDLTIALAEKESDVARGTSGKNSAVVHAGFNNPPGSLAARLCVEGCAGFAAACRELGVPYKRTGKLVVATETQDLPALERLLAQGRRNGVPDLALWTPEQARERLPSLSCHGALWSGTTAITNPLLYTIALAENAQANGVEFFLDFPVDGITRMEDGFIVRAGRRRLRADWLVNAAGLYSDLVAAWAGDDGHRIYPCRGEYLILDKQAAELLGTPVYPVPRPGIGGLGVHLTPTVDGNILIGPSAEYIDSRSDDGTTAAVMALLWTEAARLLPALAQSRVIASYAGLRAKTVPAGAADFGDFIAEHSSKVPKLINLVGIESPGLTASLPLARLVARLLGGQLPLRPRADFRPERQRAQRFRDMTPEAQRAAAAADPATREIVCRCETVTRREILDALDNPLGVQNLTGVKARSRAMTGRCQGGYCQQRIVAVLRNEYGLKPEDLRLNGPESWLFAGEVK
ncbi:MAG: NAD(P)/FAD-dependent oxidoreductase [Gracilibacteraceae bacterium]|jgi:glycerol-3-phosphate dehydrogenase|nr:NAD(P)/FAD-dependent oxidoreductase [Gracilibacteraceae bacterium]